MPNTMIVKSDEILFPEAKMGCYAPLLDVDQLLKGIEEASLEALNKGDKVIFETSLMDKTITQIEADRKKGSLEVAKLNNMNSSIQELGSNVEATQKEISSYLSEITEIISSLTPLPPALEKEQKKIEIRLDKVEKEQVVIEQLQMKIEVDQAVVQKNLVHAAQKADQIQQKVQVIEKEHQTISLQAQVIEQNQKIVQEKVEKLLPKLDKKQGEKKVSFWVALSLKVTEFVSTFFALTLAALFNKEVNLIKWKNLIHPTPSNGLNESVGLILLGAISYPVLRSLAFTLSFAGVGLSLFYTQWRKLQNGL